MKLKKQSWIVNALLLAMLTALMIGCGAQGGDEDETSAPEEAETTTEVVTVEEEIGAETESLEASVSEETNEEVESDISEETVAVSNEETTLQDEATQEEVAQDEASLEEAGEQMAESAIPDEVADADLLPFPEDAHQMNFNTDQNWVFYKSDLETPALVDFYVEALTAMGWHESYNGVQGDSGTLEYKRGDETILLNLMTLQDNRSVLVDVGDAPSLVSSVTDQATLTEPAPSIPELAASQVPLMADAENTDYDDLFERITYTSAADIETLLDFYRQEFPAQGWQENETYLTVEEDFSILYFEQGEAGVSVKVAQDGVSDGNQVTVSSDYFVWDIVEEPITGEGIFVESGGDGPPYTIDDWPIPPEAYAVSRLGRELAYTVPWDGPTTAEFFRPTFELMALDAEFCLEGLDEYTSNSCSTGVDSIYLNFAVHTNEGETDVEITLTNFDVEDDSTQQVMGELAAKLADLTLTEQEGFLIPSNATNFSVESLDNGKKALVTTPSNMETLSKLYELEIPKHGGSSIGYMIQMTQGELWLEEPGGEFTINLVETEDETQMEIVY